MCTLYVYISIEAWKYLTIQVQLPRQLKIVYQGYFYGVEGTFSGETTGFMGISSVLRILPYIRASTDVIMGV